MANPPRPLTLLLGAALEKLSLSLKGRGGLIGDFPIERKSVVQSRLQVGWHFDVLHRIGHLAVERLLSVEDGSPFVRRHDGPCGFLHLGLTQIVRVGTYGVELLAERRIVRRVVHM
ncbi:MAG: hypothetical protein KDA93_14450 [Planctomycetaceae bacterium]|nr:hypothetical protein [Planctomycetaceae bacterium]